MRKVLLAWVLALLPAVAGAQVTGPTYTFTAGTVINPDEVNSNFASIYQNALNRTGGTMTGTLTTRTIVPDGTNTRNIGDPGGRYANIYSVLGNFSGAVTMSSTLAVTGAVTGGTYNGQTISSAANLTGSLALGGTLTVSGGGNHTFSSGSAAINLLRLENTASGTAHSAQLQVGNNTASNALVLGAFASGFTTAGQYVANGGLLEVSTAGGLSISASHASGALRFYTAGVTTPRFSLDSTAATFSGRLNSASAQPGFLAYNSVDDTVGAGGATVDFDTEVYDTAGNFAADVFTAPVTGTYLLCAAVRMSGLAGPTVTLTTSNRGYRLFTHAGGTENNVHASGCVLADMDAADTASVGVSDFNGHTVEGGPSPYETYFSGRLVP